MKTIFLLSVAVLSWLIAPDASRAQSNQTAADEDAQQPLQPLQSAQQTLPGQLGDAGAGTVGQRQTRQGVALTAGIAPTARISSRIENRVQSRLRNRIDQNYDPQANAADPFAVADEQVRAASRPR